MLDVARGEVRKLTSIRSTWLLVGAAAVTPLLTTMASNSADAAEASLPMSAQQGWFLCAMVARVVFALAGLRITTDDYRFGTLAPTALAAGSRSRLLTAKALVALATGTVLSAVTLSVLCVTASVFWEVSSGTTIGFARDDALAAAGFVAAGGLWALVGLSVGVIVRAAVPASVSVVLWLLFVEDLIRLVVGDVVGWLPAQAGLAFAVSSDVGGPGSLAGGALLLAWAGALFAAAAFAFRRRDLA